MFSFKRFEKNDKDVKILKRTKECKVFFWVVKRNEKRVHIIHKKFSYPDHVIVVLTKIKLALLQQNIVNRFNGKAAKIS